MQDGCHAPDSHSRIGPDSTVPAFHDAVGIVVAAVDFAAVVMAGLDVEEGYDRGHNAERL